jgi:hypothetical protein
MNVNLFAAMTFGNSQPTAMPVGDFGFVDYALLAVGHTASTVLVAGGVCRDAMLGITPKDIDVFTGPNFDPRKVRAPWTIAQEAEVEMRQYIIEEQTQAAKEEGAVKLPMEVFDLYEVTSDSWFFENHPPIQVIVNRRPPELVSLLRSFDLGICQIGFDRDSLLVTTAAFHRDLADRTIRYAPCGRSRGTIGRSNERAYRIARRCGLTVDDASFYPGETRADATVSEFVS